MQSDKTEGVNLSKIFKLINSLPLYQYHQQNQIPNKHSTSLFKAFPRENNVSLKNKVDMT